MRSRDRALARARGAYERAHVVGAARALAIAGLACVLALALHRMTEPAWLAAAVLGATLAALAWRGGAWRRGAIAGVLAGLPPLIVPSIVFALSAHQCAGCATTATWPCVLACFGTSSLVGILVGYRAIRDPSPVRFGAGAIATAALTGLLGCGTIGLGGAIGVVVGLVAGGVTGWAVAGRAAQA